MKCWRWVLHHFSADADPIPAGSGPPLNSKPTFGALERFLRVRFQRKFLESGDNLWFFFAGHGIRYENRDYLMPSDGDPGNVERTAISINSITERLREYGAGNVILLIDACRNDGKRDGLGVGQEEQKGVVTIFSCSPNEISYEIDQLRQGSFTYALLEGLRIQGEGNCATVERLSHYVKHRTSQLTRHYRNQQQTPYPVVEPASKYHLILLPQQATVRDAETLKMDAYKAEVDREWDLAKQLWVRVLAVSPADMDAVEAIERLATGQKEKARQTAKTKLNQGNQRGTTNSRSFSPNIPTVKRRQVIQWGGVAVGIAGTGAIARILPDFELKSDPEVALSSIKLSPFSFEVLTVNRKGEQVDRQTKQAKQFVEKLSNNFFNSVDLEMVEIPGGTFTMGSPESEKGSRSSERPQHDVTLQRFFMGKYPVTQAQWKAIASRSDLKINIDLDPDPSYFKEAYQGIERWQRPVEEVSWYNAVEFCQRLSKLTIKKYELPSEAQWEYACRGVTEPLNLNTGQSYPPFYFGETITAKLANYKASETYADETKGEASKGTTPVGQFSPNAFGLYDMHGNVWEWCLDDWHGNYKNAPTDGTPWFNDTKNLAEKEGAAVLRGGSWFTYPYICRSAIRFNDPWRDYRNNNVGFRVVCVAGRTG